MQQAVGLITIDLVTSRRADLHGELLQRVAGISVPSSDLFAAAYRPTQADGETRLEVWHQPLAIGGPLPTLPFWLKNGPCIKVDFEATYMRTLMEQRMLGPGNGQQSA